MKRPVCPFLILTLSISLPFQSFKHNKQFIMQVSPSSSPEVPVRTVITIPMLLNPIDESEENTQSFQTNHSSVCPTHSRNRIYRRKDSPSLRPVRNIFGGNFNQGGSKPSKVRDDFQVLSTVIINHGLEQRCTPQNMNPVNGRVLCPLLHPTNRAKAIKPHLYERGDVFLITDKSRYSTLQWEIDRLLNPVNGEKKIKRLTYRASCGKRKGSADSRVSKTKLLDFINYEIPEFKTQIKWEPKTGMVHFAPLWKLISSDRPLDEKKARFLCVHHPDMVVSYAGHHSIQGIWMHYDDARYLASIFCWRIKGELIPIFGDTFPEDCDFPLMPIDGATMMHLLPQRLQTSSVFHKIRDPYFRILVRLHMRACFTPKSPAYRGTYGETSRERFDVISQMVHHQPHLPILDFPATQLDAVKRPATLYGDDI